MTFYDMTNCQDCNKVTSGDCGKHSMWWSSDDWSVPAYLPAADDRIRLAIRKIEEWTIGCHCQTMAYPFCEQFGCATLRQLKEILEDKK